MLYKLPERVLWSEGFWVSLKGEVMKYLGEKLDWIQGSSNRFWGS